jgi:hypothetical protein
VTDGASRRIKFASALSPPWLSPLWWCQRVGRYVSPPVLSAGEVWVPGLGRRDGGGHPIYGFCAPGPPLSRRRFLLCSLRARELCTGAVSPSAAASIQAQMVRELGLWKTVSRSGGLPRFRRGRYLGLEESGAMLRPASHKVYGAVPCGGQLKRTKKARLRKF